MGGDIANSGGAGAGGAASGGAGPRGTTSGGANPGGAAGSRADSGGGRFPAGARRCRGAEDAPSSDRQPRDRRLGGTRISI